MLVAASFTSCKGKRKEKRATAPPKQQQQQKTNRKIQKQFSYLEIQAKKHTCIRVKDN